MDFSILINWTSPFRILGVSDVLLSFLFCFEEKCLLANSADSDQTPRSAASDLGLRCLPMSQNWDVRLIYSFIILNSSKYMFYYLD